MIISRCDDCGVLCGENLIKNNIISFEICNPESCTRKIIFFTEKCFVTDKKYMIKILKDERDYVCFVQARLLVGNEDIIVQTIIGFSSLNNL
jgi:hypothetical protein